MSVLTYTICGNYYQYYKTKDDIKKNIKVLKNKTYILYIFNYVEEFNIPIFINNDISSIPIGGGYSTKKNQLLCLLKNNKDIIISNCDNILELKYKYKYINDFDNLKYIYKKYNIDSGLFPIYFPLKIYETTTTKKIYYNSLYFNFKKDIVFKKTLINNRLPLTFTGLFTGSLILGLSWYSYYENRYKYRRIYPIFHPKRYKSLKN